MAIDDEDTQTQVAPAPAPDPSGLSGPMLDRLIQQVTARQTPPPTGTPDDGTKPGWTGLLGSVLGGGQAPGYQLRGREADTSGNRALLNFGINMLLASGPHAVRPDFLSAAATGLQGAQESLGLDQQRAGARAATQYEQNRQQQQDQLARIKAAIPLLTLKQQADAMARMRAAITGQTPTPGTSIATGGTLSPFIATNLPQGVSAAEDQMVRTVIGEAANQGTVGQQAVAAVIKNRMDAGKQNAQDVIFAPNQFEPWNNPKTRAGLEAIDPNSKQYQDILNNAVRPVMSGAAKDPTAGATHFYSPTAQKALGREAPDWASGQTPTTIGAHQFYKLPYGGQAPAPGQTAAAPPPAAPPGQIAPPAPMGQNPNAKVQIPPPPTGGSALPPPEAPLAPEAGTAQVAGRGAPTSGIIPPSPPGSPATVADIMAGMVGAGADSRTLAVGPVPPGMPTGTAAAGPAGPTTPTPATPPITPPITPPPSFRMRPLTPTEQAATSYDLDPAVKAQLAIRKAGAATPQQLEAVIKDEAAAVIAQRQKADAARLAIEATERRGWQEQQDKIAAEQRAATQAEVAAQANHRRTLEAQAAQSENQYVLDERKAFGTEREASRQSIDDVQVLRALSTAAGTTGPIEQLHLSNGASVRDFLVQKGWGSPEAIQRWSTQQAFEQAANQTIIAMRKGVQMGQLSDRDMSFIQSLVPRLSQNPATRDSILATIENAQSRKREYIDTTEQLWDGGKGMTWGQARREADKRMTPIVPQVPQEYTAMSQSDRLAWFQKYAAPGTIFRGPDKVDAKGNVIQRGDVMVAPDPNAPGGTR